MDAFVKTAHALADLARPIAMRYFRQLERIDSKADKSPVTIADVSIELAIRNHIEQTHPDHGILGEEHGSFGLDRRYVWVIDPIDGTKAFISGVPLFTTLISLLEDGDPVLGMVDAPALSERYVGGRGHPPSFDGKRLHTRTERPQADAFVLADCDRPREPERRQALLEMSRRCGIVRGTLDAFGYMQLAAGHIDAVIESGLQPYDYMALMPIIEGAGGCITDWQGKPLTLQSKGEVLASSNARLHQQLLGQLPT